MSAEKAVKEMKGVLELELAEYDKKIEQLKEEIEALELEKAKLLLTRIR